MVGNVIKCFVADLLPNSTVKNFENRLIFAKVIGKSIEVPFYRAMHFSAKRGIAIACLLSVCPSKTLVDCDHIGWNSSKII